MEEIVVSEEKKKLHALLLDIALEINRVCEKNNIEYFMIYGTLLGAVRHKGFIPWDDDLDIGMTRENHDKFVEACKRDLNTEKYHLQNEWDEENYAFSFSKIQLNGTKIIEDFSKDADIHHGIFVDIFPYDSLPDGKMARKIMHFKNKMYRKFILIKCGYCEQEYKQSFQYKVLSKLLKFRSINKLKRKRNKLLTKYSDKGTRCVFQSDFPRFAVDKHFFDESKKYEFEGNQLRSFADADGYLRLHYGSTYMQLPPVEKRMVHSNYTIDFGPYA